MILGLVGGVHKQHEAIRSVVAQRTFSEHFKCFQTFICRHKGVSRGDGWIRHTGKSLFLLLFPLVLPFLKAAGFVWTKCGII